MTAQFTPALTAEAVARLAKATKLIELLIAQARIDLASAHEEICKLQGLNHATHSWPGWTPQANSLRWFDAIEADELEGFKSFLVKVGEEQ